MVISSWLSALTSKFFSKKKVTPRTRNQQSRLAAQATQASEVLESRQMLTVNAIADAYNAGNGFTITEDAVLNVDAGDGVVQSNDDLTNVNGAYTANIVTNTVHGTVTLNADGSFSYDPGDSLQSLGAGETSTETFTYNVTDNDGTSNTVEVVLTVQGVNDDPEAVDDFVTVLEDDVTPVNVLSNDSDVDGDPLILFVGAPQHGTATVNDNGTPNDHSDDFIQYTSELDYTGQDSFTYLLSDGNGGISEATVNVTVLAVNDPPVAADATFNLAENSSVGTVVGTVTATDIDAGDTKTFAITAGNDGGTFVINSTTGQITVANNALLDYESNPVFHLVVTVSDGTDAKDAADITVNLTNVQEPLTLNLPSDPRTFYSRHGQTVIDAAASVHGDQLPLFSYANSQLTVQVTGNANKNDRIAIYSEFAGPGNVSLSGSNVLYGNVVIGKITKQGSGTTAMVVKFNENATEAAVNAVLKLVTYKSTVANPPAAQRTITFTLQDATNSQHVSATQFMNVNTSAPQRGIDINGDPVSYYTGGGPVAAAPNALITGGPAWLDFDGASLSVETRGGSNSTNRLGILETGGITLSGTDVLHNGNKIAVATITNNSIKFKLASLDSTPAAVQALVRAIAFYTTASNTNLADREIVFKLTDANTVKSPTVSNTVTLIQSVANAQPTATNTTHSASYTEDGGAQGLGPVIVVADADVGEVITANLTLSNTAAGSLAATGASYNSGTGVLSITGSVATVNTALASLTFTPAANFNGNFTVGVNIQDGGEAGTDPITGTITVTGTPVNDQISVTNINQSVSFTEDGGAQPIGVAMVVSDVDAGEIVTAWLTLSDPNAGVLAATGATYNPVTGTLSISGTIAAVNTALGSLTFTPAANYDGDSTIAVNVQDAGEDGTVPVFGTITVNSVSINDQTTATNVTHSATYTEDAGAQSLGSTIVVADPDLGEVITATLTLSDLNAGVLAATGGSFNGANGTLTITGSVASVNAALASLTFTPAANYNDNFTIGVNIADGLEDGTVAVTGTITVTGTAVNDQTTATNTTHSATYTEDGGSQSLGSTIVVTDVDAGEIVTTTLTLSDPSAGALAGTGASYTSGTGVLSITGTVAEVNAALASLTFTPALNYNGSFTIGVNIADGLENSTVAVTGTITVTGTAVNDQTTATNTTQSVGFTEDAGAQSLGSSIVVSDVDAGEIVTATLTLSDTNAGTLAATGGSFDSGTGVLTITGDVATVNAALASLTFTPAANYDQSFTIAVNIADGGEDGTTPVTGTITVTATGLNDQTSATNTTQSASYTEDGGAQSLGTTIVVSDVDTGESITATLTLSDPNAGTLAGTGASYNAVTGELTITGTVAEVNAALASLTFTPALNYNGNFTVAVDIQDGLENGAVAVTGIITVTGIAVNDQTAATNTTQSASYTEDGGAQSLGSTIVVSDVDVGESITATLTLSDTAAGTLAGTGASYNAVTGELTITGTVAEVNTALASLTFTPALNYNGNFTVDVNIEDGLEDGTTVVTGTITVTGTAVNDQTSATNTTQSASYTEDGGAQSLGSMIVVSDVDVGESITATLTLSDTAAGTLAGTGASYNAVTGELTITGTVAEVNTALASLTFTPALNYNGNFTVDVNIEDGLEDGTVAVIGTITVTGTAVNDQTSATNTTQSASYTEDGGAQSLGSTIVVSDVDLGESITATLTLSNTAAGALAGTGASYNAVTGELTITGTVAEVNAALASLTFTPALNYNGNFTVDVNIQDGLENGTVAVTGTITVTGTAVNDQTAATNTTQSAGYTEDGGAQSLGSTIVVSDVDVGESITAKLTLSDPAAGALAGTGASYNAVTGELSLTGTVAEVNTALASLTFTPAAGYNGNFTVAVNIQDGLEDGTTAVNGTITVTGTAVNDQTSATNTTQSASYTEDGGAQSLGSTIVVSDVDVGESITATLTLSDPAAGALAGTGASYNAVTGELTITGTVAEVNTALASLTFTPALNYNGNFTVDVNIEDGLEDGTVAVTGTITVTGTAVNDQTAATNTTQSASYTEDGGAQSLGSTIVVSDVDVGESITATLTLSDPAAGALAGTGASYNAVTGELTITGTVAEVNTALASLTFTPALNYNGNFTVDVNIEDGLENGAVAVTGTITVTGTAVNDQTSATNTTQSASYTEDGGAQSLGSTIVVSDVDVGESITATLTLSDTAAGALAGTGASYNAVTGELTITGTVAEVNTALASLTFTPALNYNGNFTVDVNIEDGLENGAVAVTGTITVTGTAVNDQTSATNTTHSASYTEDGGAQSLGSTIVVSDVDVGESITATLTLSDTAAGALAGTGASYNAVTGELTITGTVAEVNTALASLTFTPALNYNGNFTVDVNIEDGLENGAVAVTGTITVTGTAVNDQTSATNTTQSASYTEDGGAQSLGSTIVVSDVDVGESITATLTLSDTAAGALAGTGASYNAVTGELTITGTVAEVNTALASLTFTPALNYNENFTVDVNIEDGLENGAVAVTGTITVTGTAVNDQTSATNTTHSASYTEDGGAQSLGSTIVVSDVDVGESITATLTLSDPAAGALAGTGASYNPVTGALTITGTVAEVNTALASLTFTPASNYDSNFTVNVNIEDGLENGAVAVTGTITVTGTAVNDQLTAPLATQSATYTEDGGAQALGSPIVVSDVDTNETVTVMLTLSDLSAGTLDAGATSTFVDGVLTLTGLVSDVNDALATLTFTPTANYDSNFTISVSIFDGGENGTTPVAGTITVTGTGTNDQPSATNLNAAGTYTEDGGAQGIGSIIVVSDVDVGDTVTVTLTLSDLNAGALAATGGSFNPVTGTLTISGTVTTVNAALATVTFTPASNYDQNFTIATSVFDGGEDGSTPLTGTKSITATPVNDQVSATSVNQTDVVYTPEGPAAPIGATIVVSDADANEQVTVNLTLSNPTAGDLAAPGFVYSSITGILTIVGTVSEVNTALAELTFDPAPGFFGTFDIYVEVYDDGENGTVPVTGTISCKPPAPEI